MTSISDDRLVALPTPDMVTLLFKCHKSTTVLSVLPTDPFATIKDLLLAALRSRNITTLPNSTTPLPEDPKDLELGVLADKKDPGKGWVNLESQDLELTSTQGSKRKSAVKGSAGTQCPLAAGLGDGSWVAYRLKPSQQTPHNGDAHLEEGTPDVEIDEDPGWDVILPTFDDDPE